MAADMGALEGYLEAELKRLKGTALHRTLRILTSAQGPRVRLNGRDFLMLSSNDYLGLANHPALKKAAARAMARYGVGAGASRLMAGSLEPLRELEAHIARFKDRQAALVFGSGYLANLGTITALAGPGDVILSDELNHASLVDGCRLSRAAVKIYRHLDTRHLEELLCGAASARRRFVVTDTVFSMDGDLAPLAQITELARHYDAAAIIDEAHAVGVFGPHGAGLAAQLGLQRAIDVQVGTLSKAVGAYGAYVAGSRLLIDYLVNRARSFIYSTALPPAIAAAASAALSLIEGEPWRLERLWQNARYLREQLERCGFQIGQTESPILPVIVGEAGLALKLAEWLFARGIYVTAIRPPTVAAGTARLRLTPSASHTRAELDEALAAFESAGRELNLIARAVPR